MSRVKVTALAGAYAFEGVSYGPFQASRARPFVEVPLALANALNLPLHESEVQAREATQAEAAQGGGISVDAILQANQDLKVSLDQAQAALNTVTAERDRLQRRVAELEGQQAQGEPSGPDTTPAVPAPDQPGTPLPEGLPHADLLRAGGFDTMEKLAAGLSVADGQTESPVQQIDGVGKKTVEVYTRAVADWKAGQG